MPYRSGIRAGAGIGPGRPLRGRGAHSRDTLLRHTLHSRFHRPEPRGLAAGWQDQRQDRGGDAGQGPSLRGPRAPRGGQASQVPHHLGRGPGHTDQRRRRHQRLLQARRPDAHRGPDQHAGRLLPDGFQRRQDGYQVPRHVDALRRGRQHRHHGGREKAGSTSSRSRTTALPQRRASAYAPSARRTGA